MSPNSPNSPPGATGTDPPSRAIGGTLHLHLGAVLKAKWDAFNTRAKSHGRRPASELRTAIAKMLHEEAAPREAALKMTQRDESPDEGGKRRLELRLTPSEFAAVQARANAGENTPQEWLIALLRAHLTATPQPVGKLERQALMESNYQLLKIGRNLNQIAKHLNEGLPERFGSEDVQSLRAEIRAHCERVSKTLRANTERWQVG